MQTVDSVRENYTDSERLNGKACERLGFHCMIKIVGKLVTYCFLIGLPRMHSNCALPGIRICIYARCSALKYSNVFGHFSTFDKSV